MLRQPNSTARFDSMSIDLNWETLTTGPDGLELAHRIRDFVHQKFQSVPLPRFIKSVTVHDFEFGAIPPELELKDITDPLPDFYEDNEDIGDEEDEDDEDGEDDSHVPSELRAASDRRRRAEEAGAILQRGVQGHLPPHLSSVGGLRNFTHLHDLGSPFLGVSTPGIPGGASSLQYFQSQFAGSLSGTQTPLAAVAGAQRLVDSGLGHGLGHHLSAPNLQYMRQSYAEVDQRAPSHSRNPSQSSISIGDFNPNALNPLTPTNPITSASGAASGMGSSYPALREKHSVSTLAPTSAGTSRPPTRDTQALLDSAIQDTEEDEDSGPSGDPEQHFRERRAEDIQAVFRIRYSGDVKLLLTTEILLDYPMPSFVGIPVRLSITGLSFDGVGVVANIRKRVHFCFLSPEDALAAVGDDGVGTGDEADRERPNKLGGLLQEIQVESEIGQREGGKQSLKNVGKVERFVLEQVRRIFEEEFVYPSFWTFLV